jgi:hypothetical protein
MSNYEKQLEDQNEELRQKLAASEKLLADFEEKYRKENSWRNTVLNDIVSVQPMSAPTGKSYFLKYIMANAKKKRKRFVKLKNLVKVKL